MGYVHFYRGSGRYCTNCIKKDPLSIYEMETEGKFKVICPNCGHEEIIKPNLWRLIEMVREGRGLSKSELARRAGVSRSTIYRLENGYTCSNKDTVEKIVDALKANKKLFLRKWEEVRKFNDKRLRIVERDIDAESK